MVARPCFLFTARPLRIVPHADGEGAEHPTLGDRSRFLLGPDLASLDYFLYAVNEAPAAERLMRQPTSVIALLELVQKQGAIPVGARGAWGSDDCYSFCDSVRSGAFFAVRDRKKVMLRILEGCPVIYADPRGRAVLLATAGDITRIETGRELSPDDYGSVRRLAACLPIDTPDAAGGRQRETGRSAISMRRPARWSAGGPDAGEDRRTGDMATPVSRPSQGPRLGSFNGGLPPWAPRNPTAPRWEAGRPMSRRIPPPPPRHGS